MGEGFADTGKVSSGEVYKLVMHLIMMCNDDPSMYTAESVMYRKVLRANIAF